MQKQKTENRKLRLQEEVRESNAPKSTSDELKDDTIDVAVTTCCSTQTINETEAETAYRESLLDAINKNDKSGVIELIEDAVE